MYVLPLLKTVVFWSNAKKGETPEEFFANGLIFTRFVIRLTDWAHNAHYMPSP